MQVSNKGRKRVIGVSLDVSRMSRGFGVIGWHGVKNRYWLEYRTSFLAVACPTRTSNVLAAGAVRRVDTFREGAKHFV
jgi:hypothetical protein